MKDGRGEKRGREGSGGASPSSKFVTTPLCIKDMPFDERCQIICTEEPSKAALKNKKKREAKARRKMEEQQRGTEDGEGDAGLSQQMSGAGLN